MRPLPDEAYQRPRRTSALTSMGLSRREREGWLWCSPTHGVHAWAADDGDDPLQRILAVAAALPPGAAVGGWAAAYLHGARDLDGRGRSGQEQQPVLVCRDPAGRIRREGVSVLRSALPDEDVTERDGVPVTTVLRTAFDVGRRSELTEAVVALDALARDCRLDLGALAEMAAGRRRWRGTGVLGRAVRLADPATRSCGESRLRVVWVDAGLPTPQVNARVFDEGGHLLGEVDLLDPDSGLVSEYDGRQHHAARQYSDDNSREEGLERAGLVVTRFASPDLGPARTRTVFRLRRAYDLARSRDRRTRRWTWRAA